MQDMDPQMMLPRISSTCHSWIWSQLKQQQKSPNKISTKGLMKESLDSRISVAFGVLFLACEQAETQRIFDQQKDLLWLAMALKLSVFYPRYLSNRLETKSWMNGKIESYRNQNGRRRWHDEPNLEKKVSGFSLHWGGFPNSRVGDLHQDRIFPRPGVWRREFSRAAQVQPRQETLAKKHCEDAGCLQLLENTIYHLVDVSKPPCLYSVFYS